MTKGQLFAVAKQKGISDSKLAQVTGLASISYWKKQPDNKELPSGYERGITKLESLPDAKDAPTRRSFAVAAARKAAETRRANKTVKIGKAVTSDPAQAFANLVRAREALKNLRAAVAQKEAEVVALRAIVQEQLAEEAENDDVTPRTYTNGFTHGEGLRAD